MKRSLCALFAILLALACMACGEQGSHAPVETPALSDPTPVATDAVQTPAPATPEPTQASSPATTPFVVTSAFVVECEDTINMRQEPSSRALLVGTLSNGERVRVMEYRRNYAYIEILSTGHKGYVVAGYLKPEEDIFTPETVRITDAYSYEQMYADLRVLAQAYPTLASMDVIGASVQGLDIPVLILGDTSAPHHVLVQASIHAREHMTALLVTALSEAWLQSGGNAQVCFHVIPMTNPDGVKISQETVFDEQTRKLYTDDMETERFVLGGDEEETIYLREWKANYNGVDLNRNFDALWEKVDTAAAPSYAGYRGASPASEPETQALVAYTERYDFDATISYHATGSVIYWQFGPDSPANVAAHKLADIIGALSSYSVEYDDGTSFGGYKDWASSKMGIPSLTIEIGTRSAPLPETDFYNIWIRNRFVFQAVAEWVQNYGLES